MIFQYNCSRCWDTGWVSNYFPLTGSPLDDGIFSSSPCDCAKGKENQLAKDAVKVEENCKVSDITICKLPYQEHPFVHGVRNGRDVWLKNDGTWTEEDCCHDASIPIYENLVILDKDDVNAEEKKTVKVWEAIGSGKCFRFTGNTFYIHRGDGKSIYTWDGKRWKEAAMWHCEVLHQDAEYVPNPELVDFATAYEAAKAGKVIHSVEYMRRARFNHRSELVWCTDNLKVVIDSGIIEGKWLIVEEV